MKMTEFSTDIHRNAVDHGWWEGPRTCGEIIALCHSELSEALEEYRAGRGMFWHGDGGKPEGFAVELADCIIRILDWFGKEELDADRLLTEARTFMYCDVPRRLFAASPGDYIARWHLLLSLAFSCWCRASGTYAAAIRMALCVNEIYEWSAEHGVDLDAVLRDKHAYNRNRPYRHGGKVL